MSDDDRTPETDAFWHEFRAANPDVGDRYDVVWFGDSPQSQDSLADLVVSGTKRATAGLRRYYDVEPMPTPGEYCVVVDAHRRPRCVYRITRVDTKPLNEVDAEFAWVEGEGDRSLDYWMDAHVGFFSRQAAKEGFEFHDTIDVVLERFSVVYPPELAD